MRFEDDEIAGTTRSWAGIFPRGWSWLHDGLGGEKSPRSEIRSFDMLNSTVTQSIYSRTFGNARFSTHLADVSRGILSLSPNYYTRGSQNALMSTLPTYYFSMGRGLKKL